MPTFQIYLLFTLIASIQAFAPHPLLPSKTTSSINLRISHSTFEHFPLYSSSSEDTTATTNSNSSTQAPFTHADIEWRLGPSEDTPPFEKLKLKAAANAIRTELMIKGEVVPPILCPKGGKALLEAYINGASI